MRHFTLCLVILAIGVKPPASFGEPIAPGFVVDVYATVTDPKRLSFDPTGNLYVARDNSGSGGGTGDAAKIHQVGLGGFPVVEYGNSAILDPDAVIVDASGVFGTAGAVLVGGYISNASGGQIKSILPDQSVTTLFGPTTTFHNPTDFVFDNTGRLLFTNRNDGTSPAGVYATSSASTLPSALFTTSVNVTGIALDLSDRIFVSTADGRIEIRDPNGSLVNDSFVTGLGSVVGFGMQLAVAIGQLGSGTNDLFATNSSGELLRVKMSGTTTVIGTGFASADLAFGPDGALYVSEFLNDRVLRIVPEPDVDFDFDGDVDGDDVDALVGAIIEGTNDSAFDLTSDGVVNDADLTQWLDEAATHNRFNASYLLGDANLDGSVDSADLNNLGQNWLASPNTWQLGNFTADGRVDANDLNELAQNWQKSISEAGQAAVPESAAFTLFLLGIMATPLLSHRRRAGRCSHAGNV